MNQTAVILVLELGSPPQTDWAASSVDAGSGPHAAEQAFLATELSPDPRIFHDSSHRIPDSDQQSFFSSILRFIS